MIRISSTRSFIAAVIALGAVAGGSVAHARTDVVHLQTQTVQFGHDRDRYDRHDRHDQRNLRGPLGDADRDGVPNRFDRDSRFFDARATYRHVQWGDFDRDGVVNQFDRAPRNPRRH